MIRTLLIITGASLVLCVASLAGAAALGGRDLARHDWNWTIKDSDGDAIHFNRERGESQPDVMREIAWTGGDRLQVEVPGEVTYVQGAAAGVRLTGPQEIVDRIRVVDGRLTFDDGDDSETVRFNWSDSGLRAWADSERLKITVTAPSVKTFDLVGSTDLFIRDYDQPTLSVMISGSGEVEATGRTDALTLDISGSGEADLEGLTTRDATIDIAGSGEAWVAPTGTARIDISGSGDVTLTERPASLSQNISGSGDVTQR